MEYMCLLLFQQRLANDVINASVFDDDELSVALFYFIKSASIFLPRCMECRRGLAMRILSVGPSVRLSNAWIARKRKKDLSKLIHHMKDHLA